MLLCVFAGLYLCVCVTSPVCVCVCVCVCVRVCVCSLYLTAVWLQMGCVTCWAARRSEAGGGMDGGIDAGGRCGVMGGGRRRRGGRRKGGGGGGEEEEEEEDGHFNVSQLSSDLHHTTDV